MNQVRRLHRTSGYSGNPYLILLTERDIDLTLEAGARMFWCAGARPDDLIVHCLNYQLWIGGLTDHLSLERTGAAVIPFGIGNTKALIELFLKIHPTGISCTPSYLSKIEQVLREEFQLQPRDLNIQKGFFGGEPGVQNDFFRNSIEEKWGMKAVDANFGVSDILSAFGSECECRKGLHFHAQNMILPELIDPSNKKVMEWRKGAVGELVYTSLKKEAQPLLRFRSHDLVEIVDLSTCACGRTGFKFRVLGRSDEMIVIKGINVFPSAFADLISRYPDVLSGEFQILLKGESPYDHILLLIEYAKDVDRSDIRNILMKEIKTRLSMKADVELVPFGCIERNEGKTKRIHYLDE
ncbi:MAG: phenylacetate--CoA ligase family protein [Acidobacteriota bacterium]